MLSTLGVVGVVLDTNVLLSLWVFADSRFMPIRTAIATGRCAALTDSECLAELERVLGYPEFTLTPEAQREMLAEYANLARKVARQVGPTLPQCSDRDDQKFLELACAGDARYLVTSDKALLKLARHRIVKQLRLSILTPHAFLEEVLR